MHRLELQIWDTICNHIRPRHTFRAIKVFAPHIIIWHVLVIVVERNLFLHLCLRECWHHTTLVAALQLELFFCLRAEHDRLSWLFVGLAELLHTDVIPIVVHVQKTLTCILFPSHLYENFGPATVTDVRCIVIHRVIGDEDGAVDPFTTRSAIIMNQFGLAHLEATTLIRISATNPRLKGFRPTVWL